MGYNVPMLAIFYGTDVDSVRQKAQEFSVAKSKSGSFNLNRLDTGTYAPGQLAEAAGATSLFGGAELYIIDSPSQNEILADELRRLLSQLADAPHQFVVIEETLTAADKRLYAKIADLLVEANRPAVKRFPVFSLAEALARRDKKTLWLRLNEAQAAGFSAEEIIGILWWQLKTMRLASLTKAADEAGLKPFVYDKAKRAAALFKNGELTRLSVDLLSLYHEGHIGRRNIDLALERWILKL